MNGKKENNKSKYILQIVLVALYMEVIFEDEMGPKGLMNKLISLVSLIHAQV